MIRHKAGDMLPPNLIRFRSGRCGRTGLSAPVERVYSSNLLQYKGRAVCTDEHERDIKEARVRVVDKHAAPVGVYLPRLVLHVRAVLRPELSFVSADRTYVKRDAAAHAGAWVLACFDTFKRLSAAVTDTLLFVDRDDELYALHLHVQHREKHVAVRLLRVLVHVVRKRVRVQKRLVAVQVRVRRLCVIVLQALPREVVVV